MWPGLLPVDRLVDQDRSRSIGSVDRCAQTCTTTLAGGPVDRQRALLSGSGPGRPDGRPAESFCSLYPGLVDRAVDRWHNGQKFDYWRSTGWSIISIHTKLQKCLKYLVFVFGEVLKKSLFNLEIVFEKYDFCLKSKFSYHKNSSKCL